MCVRYHHIAILLFAFIIRGSFVQVVTNKGTIKGFTNDGVNYYLGIPYATPPVGTLRWMPPQPAAPWSGILEATDYSSACIQNPSSGYTFPSNVTYSEDCLYLNIWTPNTTNSTSNKPVMVWLHGGGFDYGGNSEYRLRGNFMSAMGNVIVVNINYRLGVLGWLAHPGFAKDDPSHPTTGNYGLLDQRMALSWIQSNIRQFGGNPDAVTIMGESAGGTSVCLHMVMPGSQGLYSKAIIESGACFAETHSLEEAHQYALTFQQNINCNGDIPTVLKCMRAVPPQQLLVLQTQSPASWAVVDGYEILEHPYMSIVHQRYNKVPLLIGTVLNEGSLFIPQTVDYPTYMKAIQLTFQSFTPLIRDEYPCLDSSDCSNALSGIFGDFMLTCPTIMMAQALSNSSQTYSYVFTHAPLWGNQTAPGKGAFHSSEISFVFSTLMSIYPYTPQEVVLANTMTQYWANFGKVGNPNSGSGFMWPLYNAPAYRIGELNYNITIWNGYKSEECSFWESVFEILYNY